MKLLILTLVVFLVVIKASLPVSSSKLGVCPIPNIGYRIRCRHYGDYCVTDDSCPRDLKCCQQPCGKRCTRPDPEPIDLSPRKGCPPFDPFANQVCGFSIFRPCTDDSDCLPVEQCCPGSCGKNCLPKPPVCPTNPCGSLHIKCQYGQERDAMGCLLCKCKKPTTTDPLCPPGVDTVNCIVNPCLFATCDNPAADRCEADYCGRCRAVFYDTNGNEVNCNQEF